MAHSPPKKIKIGIMGCAAIAKRSMIPAIINHPDFELVAVASRTKEKAIEFSEHFHCKALEGYEALLYEDIDAIYMPLPTGLQHHWVSKSLEKRKHILAEKSIGLNLNEVNHMANTAVAAHCILMEDFMFQYHHQHKQLLMLLQQNAIGIIREFRASFGFPPLTPGNFRYNKKLGGGALLDAGAYTLKAAQLIFGTSLKVLAATMRYSDTDTADTSGSALLLSHSNVPVFLSWGFDNFYQCGYNIWGTKGIITTNRSFTAGPTFEPEITITTNAGIEKIIVPAENHFIQILSNFRNRILNNEYQSSANELIAQASLIQQIRNCAQKSYEK